MNILYSVMADGWGGLEKYPLTIYEELLKKGNNIYILTVNGSRLHQECMKRGIKVFVVDKIKKIDLKTIKYIKKLILELKIDVIHSNTTRELYNFYFALIGNKNIKYFITYHIGVPNHKEILHKILYKRVNKIIAINSREKNLMLENIPILNNKIELLYNGVDLKRFDRKKVELKNIREQFGIPEQGLLITGIGNLSDGKGISEFIDAAKIICDKYKNIYFLWIGEATYTKNKKALEEAKETIKNYEIDKNVYMAGYRNDIPEILKESDIFTLPAYGESFGIVYIEAMAMELPVIGCNSGGVPELIKDGKNGFLAEPRSAKSLANQFEKYIKNSELIKKHGKIGKEISERFSMKSHVEKLIKIYEG
ncbi:glycosyltransferase family 4 protein [Haliovirga abyssi]|uniref:Glycosyl transferase group 1 n=1 Tax=Haliovirga abyssi TaxID=2996794 RepID=A0AAU9D8T0_9FUSO|nr:glycosyltransferase family 4 protein [Haliovirga abyssi]BDU49675.1 glycosyl transferase group 1 [Haliovirga abyssi]